jgi:putative DNA primase/helicase
VVATEQPSDYLSVTHLLNAIISGEEVQVEEKFKPAYTVTPRSKLLWAMNDLPRVRDANDGLFRRVKVVSFPKLSVEPDRGVKEAIAGEGAGILNWALEGLDRLQRRGHFEVPACVRDATEEFRLTNDVPRMFVEEACIVSDVDDCREQAQDLYAAYRRWCELNGHKPMSSKSVSKEWKRLGFGVKKPQGRTFYTGVKVDPGWAAAHRDQFGGR